MKRYDVHVFGIDGFVPNNPGVGLRHYRQTGIASEQAFIGHFARHGWVGAWINGIYDFQHYHATAHEVLGIAHGAADVQLGGPSGPVMRLDAGDAVMIPAGVGHCLVAVRGVLSVVGAYPAGQENYDLKRASAREFELALTQIPVVPLPVWDPVTGLPFSG